VDTLGLILAIVVHAANVQDRDGAYAVLAKLAGRFPRLRVIWADGGYGGRVAELVKLTWGWTVEIVKRQGRWLDSPSCPVAGWWSGPLGGWGGIGR
jgi:putative transposase